MNLYTYHCEPTEAGRKLDHRGWSLIPRSYTLFLALFFQTFCIDRRKTTNLFLFFIALLLPFISFSGSGGTKRRITGFVKIPAICATVL